MLSTLLLAALLGQVQLNGTTYVPTTTYETTYTPTTTATTTYTPVYTYTLGAPQFTTAFPVPLVQVSPAQALPYALPVQTGPALLGIPDPLYRPGLGGRGHIRYRYRARW